MQTGSKKQSQLAVAGSRWSVAGRRVIALNKPNFHDHADPEIGGPRAQSPQTNPISPEKEKEIGRGRPTYEETITPNQANFGRSLKYQVSRVKLENQASSRPGLPASNSTLDTSHCRQAVGRQGLTKPALRHNV